ncbi:MAG: type I-C CRISPR-associated protein Cas7/Csd2 [Dehalococcoidia bacterium]|nr:type I-C CRISPR-associated protein Cas7/Csd2 [Dehalococcoidia bacterium]
MANPRREELAARALQNRYDFVLLFDVTDGNPNGDPDAGNMPRVDPETMRGFVTDVALKRKVRDYVEALKKGPDGAWEEGYRIYVQHQGRGGTFLNALHDEAHDNLTPPTPKEKRKSPEADVREAARMWMCQHFFDVRGFGAVMSTGSNAGQVRGPLQLTFARSIDPIAPAEVTITRVAKTTEERQGKEGTTEMGRKNMIPYGLYRAHGFVSPSFAAMTGFSEGDLDLFWQALLRMFEDDRSASRGFMATRDLAVFRHQSPLGNASAAALFDRVHVTLKEGRTVPRSFGDYEVVVDNQALPPGVTLFRPQPRYD